MMKPFILGLLVGIASMYGYFEFIKPKEKPFSLGGTKFESRLTSEVDTVVLSNYVRRYKDKYKNYFYAFNVDTASIEELRRVTSCKRIRVYLGLKTKGDPTSGTTIVTGVSDDGSDLYIGRLLGSVFVARGLDECTPCPIDCPWDDDTKALLGRGKEQP